MKKSVIKGKVLALSQIVHNEILDMNAEKEEGAAAKFRRMPFILENEYGSFAPFDVPVISGNSIRGLGRGLLVRYSLEDVLDLNLSEIYGKSKAEIAKRVAFMFLKGGLTPKGASITSSARLGAYDQVKNTLPWFGLLGGLYICHHWEGALKVDSLIPVTRETQKLKIDEFPLAEGEDLQSLIPLSQLRTSAVRYARHALEKDQSENPNISKGKGTENKTAALFGTEVLAGGTTFFSSNSCISDNEGIQLAFGAMFALIGRHGYIGGMSGKGNGKVIFDFEDFDEEKALTNYEAYLKAHKDEIIETLKLFPDAFRTSLDDNDKEAKTVGEVANG
jgi:hypothetical protein